MQAKSLLDQIEWITKAKGVKAPQRLEMLALMSAELNTLSQKEDWNWAKVWLDPVIQCIVGERTYDLPENFGDNFCVWRQSADSGGGIAVELGTPPTQRYAVHLYDGSLQTDLIYRSPDEFYAQRIKQETDSKPSRYTIMTTAAGTRQIVLSPPPDLATYTVVGLYKPTDWGLTETSDVPPMPNPAILKFAVLKELPGLRAEYEPQYGAELNALYMAEARNRKVQFVPRLGYGRNEYTLMRRR